jgi:hypothetical protein
MYKYIKMIIIIIIIIIPVLRHLCVLGLRLYAKCLMLIC